MWAEPRVTSFLAFVVCLITPSAGDLGLEFLSEPSSRLVKPGDGRAVFRCMVSPPSAEVRWLWQGQAVVENRWLRVSRHKLTVHLGKMDKSSRSSHKLETGLFQCEARMRGKVLVSAPAKLIIAVLEPFPSRSDVHISVISGNTAVISCNPPNSVPTVVTEFIFNGAVIDKSSTFQKIMTSGDLQILDVKATDSGEYTCVANNPYLSEKMQANHKTFLTVTDPKEPQPPRFVVSPHPKTSVVLGSNITLECVVTGYPVPTITWRREHGQLPRWRYQQVGGNLLLFGIRRGDEGVYYCEADNSAGGQLSISTVIEVQETPQILKAPKNSAAEIGQDVSLECVTRGHPKPVTTWIHNGIKIVPDTGFKLKETQLILRNVSQKNSGIYQCFSQNELGSVYAACLISIVSGNESLSDVDYANEDYDDFEADINGNSPTFHHRKEIHFIPKSHHPNHNEDDPEKKIDSDGDTDSLRKRKKKKSKGVKLIPPSRPEITRLSDTSVMVRWGVPRNDGLPILFFKVQYKEVGKKGSQWMTIDEDIAAHIHSYAVTDLKTSGKYRFRIAAVYSNNDNKLGPNSAKFILLKDPPMKKPVLGSKITHAKAASPSAITLHWEYENIDSIPIEGFFIYYRTTHSAGDYLKVTVLGANTRSHIISHLLPDTAYDIKMQCFNIAGTSEFSNIYTCKTLPSEVVGTRNRNKLQDDAPAISGTEPVSSKSSDSNRVLYMVLGVVLGVMLVAMAVFLGLCLRQKQNRQQNTSERTDREDPIKVTNGHVSANGYISVRDKVNISINPLSQLDGDESDKPDQFENMVSNNNEIIRLQTFSGSGGQDPLLAEERNNVANVCSDDEAEEADPVLLAKKSTHVGKENSKCNKINQGDSV